MLSAFTSPAYRRQPLLHFRRHSGIIFSDVFIVQRTRRYFPDSFSSSSLIFFLVVYAFRSSLILFSDKKAHTIVPPPLRFHIYFLRCAYELVTDIFTHDRYYWPASIIYTTKNAALDNTTGWEIDEPHNTLLYDVFSLIFKILPLSGYRGFSGQAIRSGAVKENTASWVLFLSSPIWLAFLHYRFLPPSAFPLRWLIITSYDWPLPWKLPAFETYRTTPLRLHQHDADFSPSGKIRIFCRFSIGIHFHIGRHAAGWYILHILSLLLTPLSSLQVFSRDWKLGFTEYANIGFILRHAWLDFLSEFSRFISFVLIYRYECFYVRIFTDDFTSLLHHVSFHAAHALFSVFHLPYATLYIYHVAFQLLFHIIDIIVRFNGAILYTGL